jgi:phosphate:Na+ symporter
MKINGSSLDPDQNRSLTRYLYTLSDFERISDHAMNICESARELYEKKMHFSEFAQAELETLVAALKETLELAFDSFVAGDIEKAYRVEPLEDLIDVLCDEMKLRHIKRLQAGNCQLEIGFVFNDLLTNIERVSDHCSNIAISLIEMSHDAYDAHSYVLQLKEQHANHFDELFKEYSEKYVI